MVTDPVLTRGLRGRGLRTLLDDSSLRTRLGQEGRRWAESNHGRAAFTKAFDALCDQAGLRDPAGAATWHGPSRWDQLDLRLEGADDLDLWHDRMSLAARELASLIPAGATILVVDEAQCGEAVPFGIVARPFPERDGQYWGPPSDDAAAIDAFESAREDGEGASFLVVVWPAFWWLDHYAAFASHLRARHACLLANDRVVVFDLRREREPQDGLP